MKWLLSLLIVLLNLSLTIDLVQAAETENQPNHSGIPSPRLDTFRAAIEPAFRKACAPCHGPEKQKGSFRIDTLDPDLYTGEDVSWWLEVFDVISTGEMPPEETEIELIDSDRSSIVNWLSSELQAASQARRSEQGHSSFRRMTRYEYNYALQDLLELPNEFAGDLPPETSSEDGFKNSSEMLQMSLSQFEQYRELARKALNTATVQGPRPQPIYYGISMRAAAEKTDAKYAADFKKRQERTKKTPEELAKEQEREIRRRAVNRGDAHYRNLETGQTTKARWSYAGIKNKWHPSKQKPAIPSLSPDVAIIPQNQRIIFDLGDRLPDTGNLRVRIRASRRSVSEKNIPTLRLFFGHQASNNSAAAEKVKGADIEISASPDEPQFYQWDIQLSEVIRNPFRRIQKLGQVPNPAEYVMLRNISATSVDVQMDYLEITSPTHEEWPPKSHTKIFVTSQQPANESGYAREILSHFMERAWRRPITLQELEQKMNLFGALRSVCHDFHETIVEVLSTILASPQFLYLVQSDAPENQYLTNLELATRLSFFLWCSTPDNELLTLARLGQLSDPAVLSAQTKRMLSNPKSMRFSQHFVRQWLGLQLLDYFQADEETFRGFDPLLKESMAKEPIAFFQEVLNQNKSVMSFIHADFAMLNDRLARHYDLPAVSGSQFRKVALKPSFDRGGLLTQAGLLAMNSDGKDSHPLKRGIWLLERILNDPPPPPPPAVPEIDLTDPDILKLTQKERMEDHRNDPACISCHAKIDPWGIAFENYNALGEWRDEINQHPVDATSTLYNQQELRGIDGLKRYLLENRQDQFARAMVYKMSSYALGRPLGFADRSSIDQISSDLRRKGDGLTDLVFLIVTSDLFQLR